MKTNKSFATLIGAAVLVIGGVAIAQTTAAPPPTSTAGNGCTATANAMKGGNLGGQASAIACDEKAAPVAAARPAPTEAPVATTTTTTASPAVMANTSEPVRKAPMRVARADRN